MVDLLTDQAVVPSGNDRIAKWGNLSQIGSSFGLLSRIFRRSIGRVITKAESNEYQPYHQR